MVERGLDVSSRQTTDEGRDDQRLRGVGARHTPAQRARGEALSRAPKLRALQTHGSGRGLDRQLAVAVARSGMGVFGRLTPLVTVAAQ